MELFEVVNTRCWPQLLFVFALHSLISHGKRRIISLKAQMSVVSLGNLCCLGAFSSCSVAQGEDVLSFLNEHYSNM